MVDGELFRLDLASITLVQHTIRSMLEPTESCNLGLTMALAPAGYKTLPSGPYLTT